MRLTWMLSLGYSLSLAAGVSLLHCASAADAGPDKTEVDPAVVAACACTPYQRGVGDPPPLPDGGPDDHFNDGLCFCTGGTECDTLPILVEAGASVSARRRCVFLEQIGNFVRCPRGQTPQVFASFPAQII